MRALYFRDEYHKRWSRDKPVTSRVWLNLDGTSGYGGLISKHDQFPDLRKVLGRYLGPTRDIGMAMTAKILKGNGRVVYRSSFIAVTEENQKKHT